jgi:Ca-activated chloride channel family protein
VLLSDGDSNSGEITPEIAANMALSQGIRVYTIGIGSGQDVEIVFDSPKENKIFRGTIRDSLNETVLQSIAKTTGGAYFYARTGAVLSKAMQEIDNLERPELRIRQDLKKNPFHQIFLYLGLVAMVLDFMLRRILVRELS